MSVPLGTDCFVSVSLSDRPYPVCHQGECRQSHQSAGHHHEHLPVVVDKRPFHPVHEVRLHILLPCRDWHDQPGGCSMSLGCITDTFSQCDQRSCVPRSLSMDNIKNRGRTDIHAPDCGWIDEEQCGIPVYYYTYILTIDQYPGFCQAFFCSSERSEPSSFFRPSMKVCGIGR